VYAHRIRNAPARNHQILVTLPSNFPDGGLKTPDAVHLAAALNARCDELRTNDLRLANAAQGRLCIVTFESTL